MSRLTERTASPSDNQNKWKHNRVPTLAMAAARLAIEPGSIVGPMLEPTIHALQKVVLNQSPRGREWLPG